MFRIYRYYKAFKQDQKESWVKERDLLSHKKPPRVNHPTNDCRWNCWCLLPNIDGGGKNVERIRRKFSRLITRDHISWKASSISLSSLVFPSSFFPIIMRSYRQSCCKRKWRENRPGDNVFVSEKWCRFEHTKARFRLGWDERSILAGRNERRSILARKEWSKLARRFGFMSDFGRRWCRVGLGLRKIKNTEKGGRAKR